MSLGRLGLPIRRGTLIGVNFGKGRIRSLTVGSDPKAVGFSLSAWSSSVSFRSAVDSSRIEGAIIKRDVS